MNDIILEAGAGAFGDANHPTTALLLGALDGLAQQYEARTICDMGCGSGVLSLRAAQLWPAATIVAADVERSAVEATQRNAELNGMLIIPSREDGRGAQHSPTSDLPHTESPHPNPPPVGEGMRYGILPVHSDGFDHPAIHGHAPYDLILMNILAEPILRLLGDAAKRLQEGGAMLLSGMLQWQQEPIIAACRSLGLELTHRFTDGEWVAHLWQRP